MQNGVDNADQLRAAANIDAISAVVYIGAFVPEPGTVKHGGRGDLVVGPRNARTEKISALFERAQVPCRISDNIEGELWTKLTWNCALNAISALGHARYGEIAASPEAKKIVANLVTEFLAVARAAKVDLPDFDNPQNAINGAYKVAESLSTVLLLHRARSSARQTHRNRFPQRLHRPPRRRTRRPHPRESSIGDARKTG